MPTNYERIQEFQPETDSIGTYFTANNIEDGKKVLILLSSIGSQTYDLRDLVAPDAPGNKSFNGISTTLQTHFEPQCSTIMERYHFHKRDQLIGETVAMYDAALAAHCKFDAALQNTLRDRFVYVLCHSTIQRRLFSENALTYTKALEIAKTMEAADTDSQKPDMTVQKIEAQKRRDT